MKEIKKGEVYSKSDLNGYAESNNWLILYDKKNVMNIDYDDSIKYEILDILDKKYQVYDHTKACIPSKFSKEITCSVIYNRIIIAKQIEN